MGVIFTATCALSRGDTLTTGLGGGGGGWGGVASNPSDARCMSVFSADSTLCGGLTFRKVQRSATISSVMGGSITAVFFRLSLSLSLNITVRHVISSLQARVVAAGPEIWNLERRKA